MLTDPYYFSLCFIHGNSRRGVESHKKTWKKNFLCSSGSVCVFEDKIGIIFWPLFIFIMRLELRLRKQSRLAPIIFVFFSSVNIARNYVQLNCILNMPVHAFCSRKNRRHTEVESEGSNLFPNVLIDSLPVCLPTCLMLPSLREPNLQSLQRDVVGLSRGYPQVQFPHSELHALHRALWCIHGTAARTAAHVVAVLTFWWCVFALCLVWLSCLLTSFVQQNFLAFVMPDNRVVADTLIGILKIKRADRVLEYLQHLTCRWDTLKSHTYISALNDILLTRTTLGLAVPSTSLSHW